MASAKILKTITLLVAITLTPTGVAMAQAQGGPSAAPGSAGGAQAGNASAAANVQFTPPPQQNDPAYQGSVPQGTASATPIPLSLNDAISRGLRANLGLLTSQQSNRETAAQRLRALSGLLPKLTGQVSETEQQVNLKAQGFNVTLPPNSPLQIPTIIGPYSYGAAQGNFSIPFFDYSAISNYRSSKQSVNAATLSVKNARDLVVQAVSNAYLQIIADAARVVATQAEVDADLAQYNNAVARHDAGTGPGIDVLRSQVELKQRQQTLVAQRNQFEKDKLTLGRIIGLALGQDFTVSDPSPSVPLEAITVPDALKKAYDHRPDFQAAQSQVRAAEFTLRASKAERYPTLTASGFYGAEGLDLITNSHGVFNVTGSVQFNIFDGGRIKGDIQQSDAELRNRRNQLDNLKGQIDYEVRNALLDLRSSGEQVEVAHSNVDLANETLRESRDRFSAGVTNTVEVVQSQQTVAEAYDNLISAQFQYNLAKVSLARSLGLAEEGIRGYFNQQP